MRKIIITISIILINILPVISRENLQHAKVTKVYDGDTVQLNLETKPTSLRLVGIDCYETAKIHRAYRQAYDNKISIEEVLERGASAKKLMEKILLENNYTVYFKCTGVDKYGRLLGEIYTSGFVSVNQEMLKTGYCTKYAS